MRCLCVLFALGMALAVGARAQAPDLKSMDLVLRSVPDGPAVAKVNDVNIAKEEFISLYKSELAPLAANLKSRNTEVPDEIRIDTAMRCMKVLVQRELLFQEAARRKLTVSDDEISKGWNAQLNRLKEAFSKMKNQTMSEDDILKLAGATRAQAMAELRKALLIEKMRDEIAKQKGVTVSDDEINKVYDEKKDAFKQPAGFHLQRIYINTRAKKDLPAMDAPQKAAAKEKMENALKRIQAGESFESVAKVVSEADDKDKGGDTGLVPAGVLPPSYTQTLDSMKPGEVSAVFEDNLGFHIVRLIEKKASGEMSIEQAKGRIRQLLTAQKSDQALNEFCKDYMETNPENVRVYLQLEKTLSTNPEFKKAKAEAAAGSSAPTSDKEKAAKPKRQTPAKKKKADTDAPAQPKKTKPKPAQATEEAPPGVS